MKEEAQGALISEDRSSQEGRRPGMVCSMSSQRVIAIGGGKGGVGKSFISANLGVAIAKTGQEVTILDADFGGANLHSLFGITRPEKTVNNFVEGSATSLRDIAIPTSTPGLSIISGTCDVLGSADLDAEARRRLSEELINLDTDCLILDVGAGTSVQTIDLFNAADIRLVVMSPELTSAQNAYGFLKVALYRRLQRALEGAPLNDSIHESLGGNAFSFGSTMERVETFLSILAAEGVELETPFRMLLQEFNARIVGNMLSKDADRNVLFALRRLITDFLGLDIDIAASFRSNSRVRTSVNRGVPFIDITQTDYDAIEFKRLARSVLSQDLGAIRALRADIKSALSVTTSAFEFGFDGVEFLEVSDITDPAALEAFENLEELEYSGGNHYTPPPPPPIEREYTLSIDMNIDEPVSTPAPATCDATERPSVQGPSRFIAELGRVSRASGRGAIHVQVQLDGHWFFGELHSLDARRVVVSGVHPSSANLCGACALRIVTMNEGDDLLLPSEVSVAYESYDERKGHSTLQFCEPFEAQTLMSYVREKWGGSSEERAA